MYDLKHQIRSLRRRVKYAISGKPLWDQSFSIRLYKATSAYGFDFLGSCLADVQAPARYQKRGDFVADPFLVRHQDRFLLYYEYFDAVRSKGEIRCDYSEDLVKWTQNVKVLDEKYHLSYPFVLKVDQDLLMVPESSEANGVFLYRSTDGLTFEKEHILISRPLMDCSLVQIDGIWVMFGYSEEDRIPQTVLFRSDDIRGPWKELECSPILKDSWLICRPGGRPLVLDGLLTRPVQAQKPNYGVSVSLISVPADQVLLGMDTFELKKNVLGPSGEGWNAHGMHHVDAMQLEGGEWLVAVDGWRYH